MGASRQRRSFSWRYSSRADSASWPSVNMSASTTSPSPSTRLHGNRPASISGCTPDMMMRRLSRPARPSPVAMPLSRFSALRFDPARRECKIRASAETALLIRTSTFRSDAVSQPLLAVPGRPG
jgi:hypothetical protein